MLTVDGGSIGIARGSALLFSDVEDGGAMWTGSGPRLIRRMVEFAEPFIAPPQVMVTLEMWDVDHSANQRMDVSANGITAESFDVVFKTWGDTRVARARVGWIAIGPAAHPDNWQL